MPSEKNLMPFSACVRQLGYRDKAWSVNRLGAVARRHGYGEACTRIINSLYGFNAMEVQEAFVKIREQVRNEKRCQILVSFFPLFSVHLFTLDTCCPPFAASYTLDRWYCAAGMPGSKQWARGALCKLLLPISAASPAGLQH